MPAFPAAPPAAHEPPVEDQSLLDVMLTAAVATKNVLGPIENGEGEEKRSDGEAGTGARVGGACQTPNTNTQHRHPTSAPSFREVSQPLAAER
jgi:hypothetical protein